MTEEKFEVGRPDGGRGKAIHLIMKEIYLACTVPKDEATLEKYGDDLSELACVKLGDTDSNLKIADVTCKNCLKIAYKDGLLEISEKKEQKKNEKNAVAQKKKTKDKVEPKESPKGKGKVKSKSASKAAAKPIKKAEVVSGKKKAKPAPVEDGKSKEGAASTKEPASLLPKHDPGKSSSKDQSTIDTPLPNHVIAYCASTRKLKPILTVVADSMDSAKEKIEAEFNKAANRNLLWSKWNNAGRLIVTRQIPIELVKELLEKQDKKQNLLSARMSLEELLLGIGNALILINNHLGFFKNKFMQESEEIKAQLKVLPQQRTIKERKKKRQLKPRRK